MIIVFKLMIKVNFNDRTFVTEGTDGVEGIVTVTLLEQKLYKNVLFSFVLLLVAEFFF